MKRIIATICCVVMGIGYEIHDKADDIMYVYRLVTEGNDDGYVYLYTDLNGWSHWADTESNVDSVLGYKLVHTKSNWTVRN